MAISQDGRPGSSTPSTDGGVNEKASLRSGSQKSVEINQEHLEPTSEGEPEERKVKLWTIDEPFEYKIPPPTSNHLETVVNKQKDYDKERCEIWKDEIDKILLFAALFSAIVTAFTLESSKRLEVDQQESTSALLWVMHQQLDSLARQNASSLPSLTPNPVDAFRVPPYAVHVNICWYLSLVLSLTAVLIGILCLQWLREHLRDSKASTATEQFFVRRALRQRALEQWHVPTFIASLPILLLGALLLFFAGLVLWLWDVNRAVAIAVSAAVGVAVLILLVTSILPVLDHRCAYRAPQAWLFYYVWRGGLASVRYFLMWTGWLSILIIQILANFCMLFFCLIGRSNWVAACNKGILKVGQFVGGTFFIRLSRPLNNWLSVDENAAEEELHESNPRPVHWEWFTNTFYQDQEAMLAFVHYFEAQATSGSTGDHSAGTTATAVSLFRQMKSLLHGTTSWFYHRLNAVLAFFWDNEQHESPSEVQENYNVGLALCHAYAVKMQPLLLPHLFQRQIESLIRITNSYPLDDSSVAMFMDETLGCLSAEIPPDMPKMKTLPQENHARRVKNLMKTMPLEGFRQQAREALFQSLTLRESRPIDIYRRIHAMLFLEADFDRNNRFAVPSAVVAMNQRLEALVRASSKSTSSTTEESSAKVLLGNVMEYLAKWHGRVHQPNPQIRFGEVDRRRARARIWYGQEGESFMSLTRAVVAELVKPENVHLQARSFGYIVEWNWLNEFAGKELGIEVEGVSESHRVVTVLPPSELKDLDLV